MSLDLGMIEFACEDPVALATFWSAVLDIPVDDGASAELAMLDVAHEHGSLTWMFLPGGSAGSSGDVAVDLTAENWQDEADRVEAAGATRVADHEQGGVRWVELLDPEGNPLKIFAPRPA